MYSVGRRYARYLGLLLGIGTLAAAFYSFQAFAAPSSISITTSPILLNLNIEPGSSSVQTVEMMNNSDSPLPINLELKTFSAQGSSGDAQINSIPPASPEIQYITFSPVSFVAQPRVWTKVKVTISLPKNASLGYYYAIVFQPVYQKVVPASGRNIIEGSNAILVLLNTNSINEKKSVQVASFKVSQGIYQYLPASFGVNIRNSGNIYLAPHGDIYISRTSSGKTIAALPVNGASGNVLPQSNRIFTTSWYDGFPVYKPVLKNGNQAYDKQGQPETTLTWNSANISKLRFGKYYARLLMTYSNGSKTVILNGQLSFWVIPWEIIAGVILIIAIIVLNTYFIGRTTYRKVSNIKKPGKSKKA